STPTRRSKKKRSPEPRRSASNPADTDPPTASSPFSTACDYVERPSAGHHIDQQDPAARPAPVNITSYGTYNPACAFGRTGLSSDLRRVRDGGCVDVLVAWCTDDERLAPHSCHQGRPRWPARPRPAEVSEGGDRGDCPRRPLLA